MMPIVHSLLEFTVSWVRSRVSLHVEIVALRHHLTFDERSIRRLRVRGCEVVVQKGGKLKKFVSQVEQITQSGRPASGARTGGPPYHGTAGLVSRLAVWRMVSS
jgi:hypothetical protein